MTASLSTTHQVNLPLAIGTGCTLPMPNPVTKRLQSVRTGVFGIAVQAVFAQLAATQDLHVALHAAGMLLSCAHARQALLQRTSFTA